MIKPPEGYYELETGVIQAGDLIYNDHMKSWVPVGNSVGYTVAEMRLNWKNRYARQGYSQPTPAIPKTPTFKEQLWGTW